MVTVPTGGDTVQLTAVLLAPLTVAFSVADCPDVSDAVDGVNEIATGTNDITALALRLEAAWLVAVTVTLCAEEIVPGAVYVPFPMVPTCGDTDHVIAVLAVPTTVPLSAVDCPP